MKPRTLWIALMLAPSVATLSAPAAAITTTTYNLQTGCTGNFQSSLVATATYTPTTCGGSGALANLTGVSDTGKSAGGSANQQLQTAYIGVYGTNLGVTSTAGVNISGGSNLDGTTGILGTGTTPTVTSPGNMNVEAIASPQHSMDNAYNDEAMLLSFNTAVSLTGMKLGWYNTDSDITVYAYTASQNPVGGGAPGLFGQTYSTLIGWTKIGDYFDVGGAPNSGTDVTPSISKAISTSTLSSYWLIAAYTGSASGTGANTLSAGNDYVKLLTVTACAGLAGCSTSTGGAVPEPPTVFLVGLALLGLTELRRRQLI